MKTKDKKAIGTTLTWMVALPIIFFILLLFILTTASLAGKKYMSFVGEGGNEIKILDSKSKLCNQRQLFTILNAPTKHGVIKELIILKKTDEIEKNIKEILEKSGRDCYLFELKYNSGETISISSGLQKYNAASNPLSGLSVYDESFYNLLEGKYRTNLILGEEKINFLIYTEKC